MQFGNPGVLWALSLLAIPIAIHLFNLRRYKTIYFSDTQFLQEVQKSTKQQRRLKEWLILFTRLLALTLVVLAFSKPYLPVDTSQKATNRIVIAVDNSASTTVGADETSPFQRARQGALELLDALPATSQVALYASGNEREKSFKSLADIKRDIQNLQPVEATFYWDGLLNNDAQTSVYALTDAQQNNLPLQRFASDSARWIVIPTITDNEADLDNVAIDSVWLKAPFLMVGQTAEMQIRLKNYGSEKVQRQIEVLTNNLPEITIAATIAARADTILVVSLTQLNAQFNAVEIVIANDNADFDNSYFLSYYLPQTNRVIALYQEKPSKLLEAIYSGDEFVFEQMAVQGINRSALLQADLIVLNGLSELSTGLENTLAEAVKQSNLLIIPSAENATAINGLCSRLGLETFGGPDTAKLASQPLNTSDPFFQDVFSGPLENAYWPTIKKHFRVRGTSSLPAFRLMKMANGDPLFTRFAAGQHNFFMLTVPLNPDYSDLESHPLIVPVLIKSLVKRNTINGYNGLTGTDKRFDFLLPEESNEAAARLLKGKFERIPLQDRFDKRMSLVTGADLLENGYYYVTLNTDTLGQIAFNSPAQESDLLRYTTDALNDKINEMGAQNIAVLTADTNTIGTVVRQWQQGIQLWRYALLLALLLIFVEVILLRYLK